jgi:hypothetical protein
MKMETSEKLTRVKGRFEPCSCLRFLKDELMNKKATLRDKIVDFWYVLIDFAAWYRDPNRTDWEFVVFTNSYGDIISYWSRVEE